MTNLADKAQNCGLVYCHGDCKVTNISHTEAQRILTLIKMEIIKAIYHAKTVDNAIDIIKGLK